jgi:NAD(P)-dependent dehydrogenase (short-subunit alcohol dehydrogenase family)
MTLDSRVVVITGARRIGAEVASAALERGADVAIVYRKSADEAQAVVEQARRGGRRAIALQGDVSDPAAGPRLAEAVDKAFGRLDVLVNMASLYDQMPFDNLDALAWRRQLGVDLDGTFFMSRAVVPLMRRGGGGRIINFCDWVAASGRPRYTGYVAYYVAKAGEKPLTEALALELAPDGILVNAVAPGPILAPPDLSPEEIAAAEQATPLGRWGGPGEIVKAVFALIDTNFTTGETIRVDGGRHLR